MCEGEICMKTSAALRISERAPEIIYQGFFLKN